MCRSSLEQPRKRRKTDGPSRVQHRCCKLTTINRFALGLFSLTHGCPDLVNGEMFGVSQTTAFNKFKHVRKTICESVPQVELPCAEEVDALCRLFPTHDRVFAALDITESERARVQADELEWHSGKLGAASMMTILLINGRGQPLAWESGIRGHNNDVGAFQKSKTYAWLQQLNSDRQQRGQAPVWVLGDGGFPGCDWVRIPTRLANTKTREEREEVRQHSAARVIVENGYGALKNFSTTDYTRRTPDTQEEMIDVATRLTSNKLISFPLRKPPSSRTLQEQKNYEYNLHKKKEIRFERKVSAQTKKLKAKHDAKEKARHTEEARVAKLDDIERLFEQYYPHMTSVPAVGWQDRLVARKTNRPCLANFDVADYLSALVPVPCQANSDHELIALRRCYESVRRLGLDKCERAQLQQGVEEYLRQSPTLPLEQQEQEQMRTCWNHLLARTRTLEAALNSGLPDPELIFYVLLENAHFRLFAVNLDTKELEFYDSLTDYKLQDALSAAAAIAWVWRTFHGRLLGMERVIQRKSQLNGTDCGVFTAMYAFLRVHGWSTKDMKKVKQAHATAFRRHMHTVFHAAEQRAKPKKIINLC